MTYHISIRILHWLMAVCIIGMIASGFYMEDLKPSDTKWAFYSWHKSFGMLLLFLFFIRIILRVITTVPNLPSTIKPIEQKASHAVHLLLYIGMLLVPLSGYLMSDLGGYPVPFFGLTIPDLLSTNKIIGGAAHEFHEIAPYVLLGVILAHIAGAIKHQFEAPENHVIKRMWRG